jgi:hypothetical protein
MGELSTHIRGCLFPPGFRSRGFAVSGHIGLRQAEHLSVGTRPAPRSRTFTLLRADQATSYAYRLRNSGGHLSTNDARRGWLPTPHGRPVGAGCAPPGAGPSRSTRPHAPRRRRLVATRAFARLAAGLTDEACKPPSPVSRGKHRPTGLRKVTTPGGGKGSGAAAARPRPTERSSQQERRCHSR